GRPRGAGYGSAAPARDPAEPRARAAALAARHDRLRRRSRGVPPQAGERADRREGRGTLAAAGPGPGREDPPEGAGGPGHAGAALLGSAVRAAVARRGVRGAATAGRGARARRGEAAA